MDQADFDKIALDSRDYYDNYKYSKAIEFCADGFSNLKSQDEVAYLASHKGSPLYVMGCAALASHDYSSASLYLDAAVTADLLIPKYKENLQSPALNFLQMKNTDDMNKLADGAIDKINSAFALLIADYNDRDGSELIDLEEIKNKFIREQIQSDKFERRSLVTVAISFVAEWHYRQKQIDLVGEGSREPFFFHLFRGCLLFESLLKAAPNADSRKKTLRLIAGHFSSQLGISSDPQISASSFEEVIDNLHHRASIESAIYNCGKARNTLGHNIVWLTEGLTAIKYDMLFKDIFASCIHSIVKLYH